MKSSSDGATEPSRDLARGRCHEEWAEVPLAEQIDELRRLFEDLVAELSCALGEIMRMQEQLEAERTFPARVVAPHLEVMSRFEPAWASPKPIDDEVENLFDALRRGESPRR